MSDRRTRGLVGFAVGLALLGGATPGAAQPAATPAPCSAPEYRQFDFWIGDWVVTDTAGVVVGHNRISRILGGCVLLEEWEAASGGRGTSHNIYDLTRDRWHQTWVDATGTLLQLDGGLDERGRMVLRGETRPRSGATTLNEIAWSVEPGGVVRQRWRVSLDGGRAWRTVFDGRYRKRGG